MAETFTIKFNREDAEFMVAEWSHLRDGFYQDLVAEAAAFLDRLDAEQDGPGLDVVVSEKPPRDMAVAR